MSEQVLYRKYRPQAFGDVLGQEHVVGAVQNALKMGRVAHAYLFSGPRGVGKTTVARLIAKSLNCVHANSAAPGSSDASSRSANANVPMRIIPCNTCSSCEDFNHGRSLNVIEIDAASNRGIDEIRELRDSVRYVPSEGKYKTYVIDECHQLTKDAFSALLKTLEEPPSHAVFILATTELDKVPATIVSRTQHYDFRRPRPSLIAEKLARIAGEEGIELSPDAGRLIAFAAEGSVRDAESILGRIIAVQDKKITRNEVEEILGLPRREAAKKMFEFVAKKDAPGALALVQELNDAGYDLSFFSKLLMQYYRSAFFLKTDQSLAPFVAQELLPDEIECVATNLASFSESRLAQGLKTILANSQQFRRTPIPQLPLELTVVELMHEV